MPQSQAQLAQATAANARVSTCAGEMTKVALRVPTSMSEEFCTFSGEILVSAVVTVLDTSKLAFRNSFAGSSRLVGVQRTLLQI